MGFPAGSIRWQVVQLGDEDDVCGVYRVLEMLRTCGALTGSWIRIGYPGSVWVWGQTSGR
jgi:hypothetical protein